MRSLLIQYLIKTIIIWLNILYQANDAIKGKMGIISHRKQEKVVILSKFFLVITLIKSFYLTYYWYSFYLQSNVEKNYENNQRPDT